MLLFHLHPNSSFGSTACELLEKATISNCKNKLEDAIGFLSEFVADYPNHQVCEAVLVRIADLHVELKQYDKAKPIYQAILNNVENWQPPGYVRFECLRNFDKKFYKSFQGCSDIVSTEYYGDLMFRAYMALSAVYNEEGNYQKALDCILETEHITERRSAGCGVAFAMDANDLALRCYYLNKKMNKNHLAIESLLKQSFEMKNDSIMDILKQELSTNYSKKELQQAFDYSIKTIRYISGDRFTRTNDKYVFNFLYTDIGLWRYDPYWIEEKYLPEILYGSKFYKELIQGENENTD